jgi:hypothetical protein
MHGSGGFTPISSHFMIKWQMVIFVPVPVFLLIFFYVAPPPILSSILTATDVRHTFVVVFRVYEELQRGLDVFGSFDRQNREL